MSNVPLGVDYDNNAPWHDHRKEIQVTVSITISKTLNLTVDNRRLEDYQDEDGYVTTTSNYTEEEIIDLVKEQHVLPHDGLDWDEDEICVIMD